MKVVFLQNVPHVAQAGEIKEVADGYGRNFLIPKKLAVLASPAAMSAVERQHTTEAETESELVELARQLEGKEVILKARAGAKDKLFGSITSADIASELQNTTGLVIDKRKIELAEPIRQLGSYQVPIKLAKDIVANISVIVAEKETERETGEETGKKPKKKTEKKTEKKTGKKTEKKTGKKPERETGEEAEQGE